MRYVMCSLPTHYLKLTLGPTQGDARLVRGKRGSAEPPRFLGLQCQVCSALTAQPLARTPFLSNSTTLSGWTALMLAMYVDVD